MKKTCLTLALCSSFVLQTAAQALPATAAQEQKRMEWFERAKLGIFIHWGIYAVDGVAESWSFYNKYIPYEAYMAQARGFTAAAYRPEQWAELIKESGARYAVITTKHHDGMALWHTKTNAWNVAEATPAGRDLIAPFVKAVRKEGLKLGFYYSLIDWAHPDYPNKTRTEKRYENDSARWARFVDCNFAQLTELNKKWQPDLYWFDGDWEQTAAAWKAKEMVAMLRHDNPQVIINSRVQGYGDYDTPEQGVPVTKPQSRYWELCMTMNDAWGYQPTDRNYKTANMLLCTFADCLSMGGNLLLDIGPKADGTIPDEQVEILKAFGRWTKKHKEAVYDTRAGIPTEHFKGYTTLNAAGDVLYLYFPYRPNGALEVKGLQNKVHRAWVVGHGAILPTKVHNKNFWNDLPGNLYIEVPEHTLDPQLTVVALQLDGPIKLHRGKIGAIESN